MLEKIKKLNDSISGNQMWRLKIALGDDLFGLLDSLLDSSTDEDAESNVKAFVSAAKNNMMKVMKARKILDEHQLEIIMDFLGD